MSNTAGTPTLSIKDRCVHWLVGDIDALPLRIFEILFTASYLLRMGWLGLSWQEWLTAEGFHLNAAELAALSCPEPLPLLTGPTAVLLAVVIAVSSLGLIFNRSRRLALLGLFASALYTQGVDWMSAFTINKLFVGVYGVLLLSPGYTRHAHTRRLLVSAVAVRVIQATLICQYFASGLAKAFKGDWLKYSDVLYTQVQGIFRTDIAAWMLRHLPKWAWTAQQWLTLLFELEAPVLFTVRKLRLIAFALGIGMHLMIALTMKNLIYFSAQMWTFYALFITADEWRAVALRAQRIVTRKTLPQESSLDEVKA